LPWPNIADDDELSTAIPLGQLAATAAPDRPTSDLLGNFSDFESLFEQLAEPLAVIELGMPLPKEKFLPRTRVGDCPAAHNEALLGEKNG
jgi:hypothetical protein